VIGHEITHASTISSQFDAHGISKTGVTEDLKISRTRAMRLRPVRCYVVDGDLHENGKLVLGESIADLGG